MFFVVSENVILKSLSLQAMAPRKRTTKKNNPKTAKLEAFLADFDGEGMHFLF